MRLLGRRGSVVLAGCLLATTLGCYQPTYAPCSVRCTSATGCPSGYSCGDSGYCQAEGETTSCAGDDGGVGNGERYLALSAGDRHSCGIREEGSLWCWGDNDDGQLGDGSYRSSPVPVRVGWEDNWTAVAAGHEHTCGIQAPGILSCWGDNWLGELGVGDVDERSVPLTVSADTDWVAVSASTDSTCGLRAGGALYCWGSNEAGQIPNLAAACPDSSLDCAASPQLVDPGPWTSIAVGDDHVCGVKTDGSIWCWGSADDGQLGNGYDSHTVYPPTQIGTDRSWTAVSGRRQHTCAVTTEGSARCWGEGWWGQLGDGGEQSRSVPTAVSGGKTWRSLAAGGGHSCGVTTDDALWCWGHNLRGSLGNGADRDARVPTQIPGDWLDVVTGDEHACARRSDGTAWCWGDHDFGQVGDGVRAVAPTPVEVASGGGWTNVSVGYRHACGLKDDGSIWCWGSGQGGELGNGMTTSMEAVPVQIGEGVAWAEIVVGHGHTCARTGGQLYCWGANSDGQLGNGISGETAEVAEPTPVVSWNRWMAVAPDGISTAALDEAGGLWITGHGAGSLFTRAGAEADLYGSVSSARDTYTAWETCAVRTDGTLWCTLVEDGALALEQIGASESLLAWETVSLGGDFGCGLVASSVYCWGENGDGQLGNANDGVDSATPTPARVDPGTVISIAAGVDHACAITDAGRMLCWGDNERGQLGTGEFDDEATPTEIAPGTVWTTVSAGYQVTCGIRAGGSLWCWGTNFAGQLGTGVSAAWQPAAVAAAQ